MSVSILCVQLDGVFEQAPGLGGIVISDVDGQIDESLHVPRIQSQRCPIFCCSGALARVGAVQRERQVIVGLH